MASQLAPVYLDDTRVFLQGDPAPAVAKVLAAGGKAGAQVQREGREGPLQPDEVLDRSGAEPIRLRVLDRGEGSLKEFAADESTGAGASDPPQPSTSQQFGAGRPGMAGSGATGALQSGRAPTTPDSKPGTQAKSDFVAPAGGAAQGTVPAGDAPKPEAGHILTGAPGYAKSSGGAAGRNGDSNRTYGAGDLAPGGRTSMDGGRNVGVGDRRDTQADAGHVDGSQEFQSGGRQGEGGAPPYRDPPAIPDGPLRDQSTDGSGRPQGQPAEEGGAGTDKHRKGAGVARPGGRPEPRGRGAT